MDLITNIVVSVLTFIAGLLTNILAHDICASADRVCTKIIYSAARRLATFDQEPVKLEWLGDLSERETIYEKYSHAIGCYVVAGRMRRRALTVTVQMFFLIAGVGKVPLSLKLGPPIFLSTYFAATGTKVPSWFSKPIIVTFICYMFAKFLFSARRLGPVSLQRFADELKQFKKWEYEAHIVRKGIDLDLSKIFKAMVLDHKRIPQIIKALDDALNKKGPSSTQT